eukprot:6148485-Alexandrium_andersonii.AAC.1
MLIVGLGWGLVEISVDGFPFPRVRWMFVDAWAPQCWQTTHTRAAKLSWRIGPGGRDVHPGPGIEIVAPAMS